MKKVAINIKHGGFGLSEAAYEKLIEWGIPVQAYIEQKQDPDTLRYLPEPANEGEVIFDRTLYTERIPIGRLAGRYWDTWSRDNREHPMIIRVIEELGDKAAGKFAKLSIVEIPDDVKYTVEEYDGFEHIAEEHRTWP